MGPPNSEFDLSTLPRFVIDHGRYLEQRPYRRLIHAKLRNCAVSAKRGTSVIDVFHERNWSCCARESWERTALRIERAVEDDFAALGTLRSTGLWYAAGRRS